MAEMRVITPGLLTTVQDRGRWGFQSRGVSVAGPMDACAHRLANALVGNAADAATLEVTLVGPEIEFDDRRTIAVTGAAFEIALDGRRIPPDRAVFVDRGSRLTFGGRLRGTRAYLGVNGGIAVTPVFGSRATHLGSRLGGVNGRSLRAGDRLPLGAETARPLLSPRETRTPVVLLSESHATVRVLPGRQHDAFTDEALSTLQASTYTISHTSDRMGFRLEGTRLRHSRGADIISEATPMGAVQVPASGLPILLMADRQTTGGYPTIATVITADLGLAGQLGPGDTIAFAVCSPGEALAALIAQERALMAFERPEGS